MGRDVLSIRAKINHVKKKTDRFDYIKVNSACHPVMKVSLATWKMTPRDKLRPGTVGSTITC